jgi:hypothetical protein
MKERPILFSAPMVRAILAGTKTQTRRIVKPQPEFQVNAWYLTHKGGRSVIANAAGKCHAGAATCAPFKIGQRLWVRETFMAESKETIHYRADGWGYGDPGGWKPSIFMPRWASRITLEITDVRAERLQKITEADAKAEGAEPWEFNDLQPMTSGELGSTNPYRGGFACLWDHINDEKAPWFANPWVWVVSFRRLP